MRIDIRDSKYSVIYNEKTGVVVTARWTADSPDIAEGSKKLQIAAEVVRRMMTAMDKAMKAEKDHQWAAYMEEQKLK